MSKIMNRTDLLAIKTATLAKMNAGNHYRVVVGMATCGLSAGANYVYQSMKKEVESLGLTNVDIEVTGCIGSCTYEPIVEVFCPGEEKISYIFMTPEKGVQVVKSHFAGHKPIYEYTLQGYQMAKAFEEELSLDKTNIALSSLDESEMEMDDIPASEPLIRDLKVDLDITHLPFYAKQKRVVMHNCGLINPEDINEYIAMDGYFALAKSLLELKRLEVIDIIMASGLRGRGGAGFPTGVKWKFAYQEPGDEKYFICNADEGDPGAFMDRSLLEGDPHSVIEAMIIAGYAIGAHQGYIYVRAEYPVAVKRLNIALDQAKNMGLLGKNILGSGFDFNIDIRLGAGAFVCGEETALIASVEGKRGMPRNKPPFPAHSGLFNKPTIINNVETLGNVAQIILKGASWFTAMGTQKSPGTKVFALGGKITNTGLVEVPMGITLREIIYDIGGGCPNGKELKAIQTGGPSGGCITTKYLDLPIDFDNLTSIGSMMGSGGMIVMDEDNCMVDIARFYLDFTVSESCGKCTPCREGTKRLLEIVTRISEGKGKLSDINLLEDLGQHLKDTALCALGQTAPNPVLSTLENFKDEYLAHIVDKRCPAHVCKKLLGYEITDDCRGCTKCVRYCPVHAITGKPLAKHHIDPDLCIRCGACFEGCAFHAIVVK